MGQTNRQVAYWQCSQCKIIGKDPKAFVTQAQEADRYLQHNNTLTATGYRDHLLRLLKPALARTENWQRKRILDYGCGPNPNMAALVAELGGVCESFDPAFFPANLKGQKWDLILCNEVVEHFRCPRDEFAILLNLVAPGGLLALATNLHSGPDHFRTWWYQQDPTHLHFYSKTTWNWIAQEGWQTQIPGQDNLIFLLKPINPDAN